MYEFKLYIQPCINLIIQNILKICITASVRYCTNAWCGYPRTENSTLIKVTVDVDTTDTNNQWKTTKMLADV